MDWNDLRYFAELVRSGSLSAAARSLGVDHTTIARRISALEQALGLRLFDRLPRGYVPTPEGEQLAEQAYRVEEEALAFQRLAQGRSGGPGGVVRISAPPAFASHFIAPRLPALRARSSGLQVELSGDTRTANLSRREADLALRLMRPEGSSLIGRRIGTLGYGLYAAPGHVLERPAEAWDFLGYEENLDHVPQQQWLRRFSGTKPLVFRSNDLSALLQAAKAGLGVAVLPFFLSPEAEGLVRLDATDHGGEAPRRDLWLVVHPDLRRAPRVRAVMDFLAEAVAAAQHRL